MLSKLFYIGLLNFFAVMTPGPDFAIVTKNTMLYSRKTGFLTALGIGLAIFLHIVYCALGFAIIITHSFYLFTLIALCGGGYLIFSGISTLKASILVQNRAKKIMNKPHTLSWKKAIKNGFFTNILNPKAILFFLAIFSFFIDKQLNLYFSIVLALELFVIVVGWFCFVSYMLSHDKITKKFEKIKPIVIKITGIGLILMGAMLICEELFKVASAIF